MTELLAVVGQNRVDLAGHGLNQRLQEVRRRVSVGFFFQLREGQLRGAVDRDKQVELTSLCIGTPGWKAVPGGLGSYVLASVQLPSCQ